MKLCLGFCTATTTSTKTTAAVHATATRAPHSRGRLPIQYNRSGARVNESQVITYQFEHSFEFHAISHLKRNFYLQLNIWISLSSNDNEKEATNSVCINSMQKISMKEFKCWLIAHLIDQFTIQSTMQLIDSIYFLFQNEFTSKLMALNS